MTRALLLVALTATVVACGSESASPPPAPHDVAILRAGAARTLVAGGAEVVSMPAGQPAPGWRGLYGTDTADGITTVARYDLRTGRPIESTRLKGRWTLPATVVDGAPDAATGDGRTFVLSSRSAGESHFALLDASLARAPRFVDLPGRFVYDAISPDAGRLFLIQDRGAGLYRVRAFDLGRDELMPGAVMDKREPDEPMEGLPMARAATAPDDPWVYTLYRKDEGPFVHALNTEGYALCIDLPAATRSGVTAAREWGLALAADGSALYAANPALGLIVELATGDHADVRRVARFPRGAIHASTRLAVGDDAIYVPTAKGIVEIDPADLRVRRTLLPGQRATAVLAAGGRLHAQQDDAVVALDAATGAVRSRMRTPAAPAALAAVMRAS